MTKTELVELVKTGVEAGILTVEDVLTVGKYIGKSETESQRFMSPSGRKHFLETQFGEISEYINKIANAKDPEEVRALL